MATINMASLRIYYIIALQFHSLDKCISHLTIPIYLLTTLASERNWFESNNNLPKICQSIAAISKRKWTWMKGIRTRILQLKTWCFNLLSIEHTWILSSKVWKIHVFLFVLQRLNVVDNYICAFVLVVQCSTTSFLTQIQLKYVILWIMSTADKTNYCVRSICIVMCLLITVICNWNHCWLFH